MADKILFGIPEDNNPELTRKLAHGTGTEEARSMTFAGLITWLTSRLPFFNTANNLSEANAATVRTNLSVNSIAENTAALALKADKSFVEAVTIFTITPANTYTIPDAEYGFFIKVNNSVITLHFRLLVNGTPATYGIGIIPIQYRPSLDSKFSYASGLLIPVATINKNTGVISLGYAPSSGDILVGSFTWIK